MRYDSQNDGLMNLLDFTSQLGIVGLRKEVKPDDFLPIIDVSLNELYIDEKYQRLLNEAMIKNAGEFKPVLYSPLRLCRRPDEKYAIVDGQHESVLAAIYCVSPETMTLQAQVLAHDPNADIEQCVEKEAVLFKEVNINRTSVSQVAQLRTDIAAGVKEALDIQDTLFDLCVHVEKIGDPDGLSVKGYAKLLESVNTYGLPATKEAINYYHKLLTSTKSGNKWRHKSNKPIVLLGALIGGLAAVMNLRNSLVKGREKRVGLDSFIESELITKNFTLNELTKKTAGPSQAVLIARRFIDVCKTSINLGVIEGGTIGEAILAKYGLGDPSVVKNMEKEDIE